MKAAVVIPDASTWLLWGEDVRAHDLRPVGSALQATALAVAGHLPQVLAEAAANAWAQMPPARALVVLDGPCLGGLPAETVLHTGEDRQRSETGDPHQPDHSEHDHMDMMEVTGEPSADGLVMEDIEFDAGPLAPGLPAGLSIRSSLDGDVVCECHINALLQTPADSTVPDPLCGAAWRTATVVAAERAQDIRPSADDQWRRVAAVEVERAASHLAWLHRLASLLGWAELEQQARKSVLRLVGLPALLLLPEGESPPGLHRLTSSRLDPALAATSEVNRFAGTRRFASRLRGGALTAGDDPRVTAAGGPTLRATGGERDNRSGQPAYAELGFAVQTQDAGDAEARAFVRLAEAEQSLRLAGAAVDRVVDHAPVPGDEPVFSTPAGAAVEGPRGLLLASELAPGSPVLHAAPGAAVQLDLAAATVRGVEWAQALVAIASFDLSPWRVG